MHLGCQACNTFEIIFVISSASLAFGATSLTLQFKIFQSLETIVDILCIVYHARSEIGEIASDVVVVAHGAYKPIVIGNDAERAVSTSYSPRTTCLLCIVFCTFSLSNTITSRAGLD